MVAEASVHRLRATVFTCPCPCRRIPSAALLLAVVVASSGAPLTAQLRPSAPLQESYFAWDEGRYVEALEGYLEVLEGPDAGSFVQEIARLTGELHPVRQLDDDGVGLRVSADGRYLLWTRPDRDAMDGGVTVVTPTGGGEALHLPGDVVAVSGAGEVAHVEGGELRVGDLETGEDLARVVLERLAPVALAFAPERRAGRSDLYLTAVREQDPGRLRILKLAGDDRELELLELGPGHASDPLPAAGGRFVVFTRPRRAALPAGTPQSSVLTADPGIGVLDLETGEVLRFDGRAPSLARDGSFLAFVDTGAEGSRILGLRLDVGGGPVEDAFEPAVLVEAPYPLDHPAVAPEGDRVAYQARPQISWEVFLAPTQEGGDPAQLTREAQHDQFPAWISPTRLLAMKGEFRHRRSYLYDVETAEGYRLFFSDALRTIAPEYEWAPHPAGEGILLSAERDGDTISPERPIFWVDLTRALEREELAARVRRQLDEERELLQRGEAAFLPVADEARVVTGAVSRGRIFHHARDLYRFGPKFITDPGNARATRYLAETLESWGYDVELQWFEPFGMRSANVIATLPGTSDPEIVYVVSSHFDSVPLSPGADDNTSGTTALLEAARVLRDHPRRATVQFAFLNAEEAGLLGAHEFVRRATDEELGIAAVLNNDMVGWARSHRLDNTIRHGNAGIRDIQHVAAHYFSNLITYDAFYTRGTDAAVFQDAYGDVVGGIGSYPVLGSPHYHQPTDRLHTVDQRLVAEVSRATVASLMLLADSPAPLADVRVLEIDGDRILVGWPPAPEEGVSSYRVRGTRDGESWVDLGIVDVPRVLVSTREGFVRLEVRAIGSGGTEGWDWASLEL